MPPEDNLFSRRKGGTGKLTLSFFQSPHFIKSFFLPCGKVKGAGAWEFYANDSPSIGIGKKGFCLTTKDEKLFLVMSSSFLHWLSEQVKLRKPQSFLQLPNL